MTLPVPLTDNESHTIDVGPVYCPTCKREYGNTEAEALREALRIAVEGLATVQNGQRCEKVVATAPESSTCLQHPNMTRDARYLADRWCDPCIARHAEAAVRELVDLGEKP